MEMVVRSMETAETAMETDGDGSGGTSLSRQGARTETYVPLNLSTAAAELQNCSGKTPIPLGFSVPRLLIGEGAALGGDQGLLTRCGRGQGLGRAPLLCGRSLALLWLSFGVRYSSGKNKTSGTCFVQFREYFLCSFSETQKQQKTGNWHCGILSIG
jgi:hypothetical protein